MPKRIQLLWLLSALLLAVLYLLSIWTKPGYVVAEVNASEVRFKLDTAVHNLMQLNRRLGQAQSISVGRFAFITLGEGVVAAEEEPENGTLGVWQIQPEEEDVSTHTTVFSDLLPDFETLPKDTEIRMAVRERRLGGYELRMELTNLHEGIFLTPQHDTVHIKPKRAQVHAPKEGVTFEEEVYINTTHQLPWQLIPQEGQLVLTFTFDGQPVLQEEDVMFVSGLKFNTILPDRERSSILSGTLRIEESDTEVDLGRNSWMHLGQDDTWEITSLALSRDAFHLFFEGQTNQLELSYSKRNYLPTVLEWLVNNNYLLLLFNSYMIVIGIYLSVTDRYRDEKKKEDEEEEKEAETEVKPN